MLAKLFVHLSFCAILPILFSCSPQIPQIFKEKQLLHYSHSWEKLENYPIRFGRTDDLFFFNPNRGFVINSQGYVMLTEDGGDTWEQKFRKKRTFFRCLTFKDSMNGWLGTLGTGDVALNSLDTISMYETKDSGETWAPTKFNGPYPKGLCGLQTVSDNVIVGCGRVRGPSYFIKTENGGKTWNSYDYNHLAGSLIAPHFYDEKHGILIGGTTTDKKECRSLVLETFDGGDTWDTLYISKQKGEYCWKVSFPTKNRGFISIQRNVQDGDFYVLQTEDGGKTWFENIYIGESYYVQGVGFISENVGWLGGSNKWTMETRDGGKTWLRMADIGKGFNKFQFFGDSLAYGVGFGVFKMTHLKPLARDVIRNYYEDGNLKSEISYENGMRQGPATFYTEDGKLLKKGSMKNNLETGRWEDYSSNSEIPARIQYKFGVAKISKKDLLQMVGSYEVEEGVLRKITYKDGKLFSKISSSERTHEIIPISLTEFVYDFDENTRVAFFYNKDGNISHHVMKNRAGEKIAKKLF